MVGEPYKEFATKILDRYENERPFADDPDAANAEEQATAEREAAAAKASAAKDESAESETDSKA